jgi:replicative DNA helicase
MGKTALAVNIGEEVASGGKQVLMFSMEMSASQLIDRRVSAVGGINLKQLRDQNLDGDELTRMVSASASLRDRPFYIDDRSALPIDEIHATCDAHKARNGLGLVIVDYLGLATKPGAESRIHEVRAISSGLKKIAKDLNIPVLALAQLNRRCEERADKRPLLSDLRESGDIEQDADIVSFLYRESYYEKEAVGWHGVAEIITAKNRNGEVGTDYVAEQLNYSRFRNLYGWTKPERKKSRGPNL